MSFPFVVGRAVLSELGERALHEIARNIWPVDCQACGESFAGERPSLAVDDLGAVVTAALYHRACRSSVYNTSGALPAPAGPFLSYSTAAADVTVELDDGTVAELPLVIVNPSLEQVFLRRDPAGMWTCGTVDYMRDTGFGGIDTERPVPDAQVSFADRGNRLRIQVGADGQCWDCPIQAAPDLRGHLLTRKGAAVALTTAYDPQRFPAGQSSEFLRALASPDVAVGWVRLGRSGDGAGRA